MKILISSLTIIASCAFAQLSAPAWLSQIRLSGLSGPADHRLAVINDKTFATGEENHLKLKGATVHVQCLEIRDKSVLIRIQDLPSRYELTMAGDILVVGNISITAAPPQPVAKIEPPASAPLPPAKSLIPISPTSRPSNSGKPSSFSTIQVFAGIFFASIVIALLVGIALVARLTQTRHRKNVGEAMLAETIGRHFSRLHLLLNNITLRTTDGTTQIDHVLVADTGIFVIETKHYSGWIFGNPNDRHWTQTIYRKKSRFQNPLHQNYGHVKTLQSLFDLPEVDFHSVVVFTADAEFKTDPGPNVVRLAGLIPFLTAERPVLYDERKMAYIIGRIEMKRDRRSLENDEYHISHVRNRLAGQTAKRRSQSNLQFPPNNPFGSAMADDKYKPKS